MLLVIRISDIKLGTLKSVELFSQSYISGYQWSVENSCDLPLISHGQYVKLADDKEYVSVTPVKRGKVLFTASTELEALLTYNNISYDTIDETELYV